PGIDLGLGPVQLAMVGRLAAQVAPVGLDLLQAVELRVVAVGPTTYPQARVVPFEGYFRLVALPPPGRHPTMTGNPLLGRGRWREAQVKVANLGAELAQGTDGHGIGHAAASRQRTWHTAT